MKRNFIVLCFLMSAMTLFSQNDSIKRDSVKTINLNDIVVTGYRPNINTPISQKTLTSIDINSQYFGQEMIYILGNTPAVNTQSDGGHLNGYTYFSIRGIDQTRVNVSLNGCPLNEPEDFGIYFSNYPGFAMSIKSMQIQRGIGTSTNGIASYGGSINFESKNGLEKSINVNISNGSFETQTINASYASGLINNKFSLFANVSEYSSDGYRYNSGGSGYSGFISGGYYGTNDVFKLTAFTGRSLNKMAYLASPIDSINKDSRHNPISGDGDDFSQSFVQVQNIHSTSKDFVFTSTVYYNRLDGKFEAFGDYAQFGSNFIGVMTNYLIVLNNLKINTGFHLNEYERQHNGTYYGTYYTNTGNKSEGSFYTKFNYDIKKFNIYADLQLRNVKFTYDGDKPMKRQNWTFINPRFGCTYNISEKENAYFSIGNTNREPTRSNMFGGKENFDSLYNIIPETATDYELGYNLATEKFRIQANLFYMDFKNEITLAGAPASNALPITTTVDRSFRTGAESDLTYKISNNFTTNNITALLYSKFHMNSDNISRTPLFSPLLMTSQDIECTYGSLLINLCGQVSTDAYISLSNEKNRIIPAYFLLNLKISYQCTKNLSLTVRGNNLTNTRFYTGGYVDNNGDNCYFIGTPINFYTTLSIKL